MPDDSERLQTILPLHDTRPVTLAANAGRSVLLARYRLSAQSSKEHMLAGLALFVESVTKVGHPEWRPKDDIVQGLWVRGHGYRCYARGHALRLETRLSQAAFMTASCRSCSIVSTYNDRPASISSVLLSGGRRYNANNTDWSASAASVTGLA